MKPIHLNSLYKYSSYLKSRYYDFLKDDLHKSFGDHLAFHHPDGSVTVLHNDGSIARQIDLIEGGTHPSDSLVDQVTQLDRRMDMRLESMTRRLDRLDSRPINGSAANSSASASHEPREPTSAIIAHYAGDAIYHPDSNVGRMAHITLDGDRLTGTLTGDFVLGQRRFMIGDEWHALPVTESYSITMPSSHPLFALVRTIATLARVKFASEPRLVEGDKLFCTIRDPEEVIRFLTLVSA